MQKHMFQAPVYMSKVRDMPEPLAMDLDRRDPNNLNEHLQVQYDRAIFRPYFNETVS